MPHLIDELKADHASILDTLLGRAEANLGELRDKMTDLPD